MSVEQGLINLQGMAQSTGLPIAVHHAFTPDARRTVPRYRITINGAYRGPTLDYSNMNHFLLGMCIARRQP